MTNRQSKTYKAFTLAEVLVTLTIIGIVAALTIPSLVHNVTVDQYKTAWKKAFSVATLAYMRAIDQNGGSTFGNYDCYDGSGLNFYNAFKQNFSVVKECTGGSFGNCWAPAGVTPDSAIAAGCPYFHNAYQNNSRSFLAADGMTWFLYSNGGGTNCPIMAVDVNGLKGPNQWNVDVFTFTTVSGSVPLGNKLVPGTCISPSKATEYLLQ